LVDCSSSFVVSNSSFEDCSSSFVVSSSSFVDWLSSYAVSNSGCLDGANASRSIAAAARQDDRERALAEAAGERFEQEVDRRAHEVHEIGRQGGQNCRERVLTASQRADRDETKSVRASLFFAIERFFL
jgi:hypothetical protein